MRDNTIQQRPEFTFRENLKNGRHGWIRLTPAYSVTLVTDILNRERGTFRILDPFAGTGTTTLCAAEQGKYGVGIDINPFLVWLGNAKIRRYTPSDIATFEQTVHRIIPAVRAEGPKVTPPPIHNVERWWHPPALDFLCRLKYELDTKIHEAQELRDLLYITFCRVLIMISRVAFNHQSLSFNDESFSQGHLFAREDQYITILSEVAHLVSRSAMSNPRGTGKVIVGDSRMLACLADEERFDLVITSPPYVNRMSYIRELRPYMYWLGYITEAREAGELDWQTIGGTWGVATSRLAEWRLASDTFLTRDLHEIIKRIRSAENKHSFLMAQYVAKYFEDMWMHVKAVKRWVQPGGHLYYIIGNAKFYDVVVPVERVLADMMRESGYEQVSIETVRKRNSKKELFEYIVSARKPKKDDQ
ncbi:SAM-dependent methyltransferase [Chloroflexus sp.]|uniref:SAM-dependent methyltransferase n=1 Tax=Chloroflexus sp. TaxID=1904827 RepID=UPI002ACE3E21|nr:SAM-dependent methyltransferase [Chloroflexus sp.]